MWTAKFQFDGSNILYGRTAKKFNAEIKGYYLYIYEKNNLAYVTSIGSFTGKEEDKKKAIKELKKDPHVLELEENKDFIFIYVREEKEFKPFFSHSFFHVSPIIISNRGIYSFHIASWYRKDIEKLLKRVEKLPSYKLLSIKEEKIDNISISGIHPNLTDKQKRAYKLAVEKGYYEYPKKITIKELAKLFGVSYSTFQQHLSYAEGKVGKYFIGKNTD